MNAGFRDDPILRIGLTEMERDGQGEEKGGREERREQLSADYPPVWSDLMHIE